LQLECLLSAYHIKKKNVSKKTIHVATSKDKRIYLKIKHIEG